MRPQSRLTQANARMFHLSWDETFAYGKLQQQLNNLIAAQLFDG
jgi:hypothetical protein